MSLFETVRVALESILANLLRSTLTMLGIIIGVSAVITMIALGSGAQRAIDDQIDALGAQIVSIYPGQSFHRGIASASRVSLKTDDAEALARDSTLLAAIVPEITASRQAKYINKNLNLTIRGTTPNYDDVHRMQIAHGRMFTESDNGGRKRVAVLGSDVPEDLEINPASLIGRTIAISKIPFEIIGVFEEKGSSGMGGGPDDDIFIPLSTAQHRVFGTDRLRTISVQIADHTPLEMGMVDIERVLRREHKIRPGGDNDFMILNRRQILDTRQQATEVFAYLLASIAGVSLLVGGIGIMNIMLVSVTERTREIGVRKALGATSMNIMMQFVIEALTIGALGGLLGILVGMGGAFALSELAGWQVHVSPDAVVLAVAFSVGIGLFFGIWPARRAAKLDPIEALRHD